VGKERGNEEGGGNKRGRKWYKLYMERRRKKNDE